MGPNSTYAWHAPIRFTVVAMGPAQGRGTRAIGWAEQGKGRAFRAIIVCAAEIVIGFPNVLAVIQLFAHGRVRRTLRR